MTLATAAVQHALEVGAAYRQNMALRHGLERPRNIDASGGVETTAPRPAQVIPIAEAAPTLARGGLAMSPAGAALAAATLASVVSAGAGWLLAGRGVDRPQTQAPAPPAAAEVVIEAQPAGRDDLLGYLQERGAHLPPGGPTR